ncbi:hypothetical protein A2673_02705 [Candidatus Kaiserbacteria bacterium RIFCSPHIGHO2_01_FULL_50_13]|uniref:Uncharacterized protein n=1 Tax=Candidatus Kaiserbacteria bacterium RIFCSPLOWO2_01_FULL_50_24 TaxID=1798507 RepID=A0A1F6ER70_9BACT|nr:MAG: hypothetical protein A2673_02705 [Candidatus Kaiserbacteria bacterium RIFCSPHIGHO2_01_FULL_50_13]OGG76138.1 MAG: hypothetical protein A3A34_01440 [Candidatus Kaiserbacteria bacterium RIFCSPLOWO2_01_FULL_50_24]OGG81185.1 MAG: hypothetical protein A3H74_01900 [Candidatus Kaiserbacteria bacterium RIFCSPLOWO2_02_FULL_51_13]
MNLLPDTDRKRVAKEHWNKMLLVGSLIFIFVACVALLALFPAVLVSSEQRAADAFAVLESRSEQLQKDRREAQEAQALIAALLPVATSTTRVERVLLQALALRPSGVRVEAVSFQGGDKGNAIISGSSENRDALNAYKSALENSGSFTRVSVPVGALVGTLSGLFSITLTL